MRIEPPKRQAGFTLLELMLVLTVAAVILGIGVPNFRQFMLNNRMTSAANDLHVALHTARSESIKRHQQVVMCFSDNPGAAVPTCSGNGSGGWVVFVDDRNPTVVEAGDNNGVPNADEPIIISHTALPTGVRTRPMPASSDGFLAYNASGFSRDTVVGERFTGIVLCDSRGNVNIGGGTTNSAARALIVSATGRPRVTRSVTEITGVGACP